MWLLKTYFVSKGLNSIIYNGIESNGKYIELPITFLIVVFLG